MTNEADFHRRADGSLDTSHYMAKGRMCRSKAAHDVANAATSASRRSVFSLAALLALVPFLGWSN